MIHSFFEEASLAEVENFDAKMTHIFSSFLKLVGDEKKVTKKEAQRIYERMKEDEAAVGTVLGRAAFTWIDDEGDGRAYMIECIDHPEDGVAKFAAEFSRLKDVQRVRATYTEDGLNMTVIVEGVPGVVTESTAIEDFALVFFPTNKNRVMD